MARRTLLGLSIALLAGVLFFAREHTIGIGQRSAPVTATPSGQASPDRSGSSGVESHGAAAALPGEPPGPVSKVDSPADETQILSSWKRYDGSEYGFHISYPAEWEFDDRFEDNYGHPPPAHGRAAYAGETRTLFNLEMDGPDQSHEGGGEFSDGAIVDVHVTGASGQFESWNITPSRPWYLITSTVTDWVKLNSSLLGGDGGKTVVIDTNGFKGSVHIVCNGSNPCRIWGEEGAAYRTLPSGRVLLISWERMAGSNDFSYQKYFLPMLASLRLLN